MLHESWWSKQEKQVARAAFERARARRAGGGVASDSRIRSPLEQGLPFDVRRWQPTGLSSIT